MKIRGKYLLVLICVCGIIASGVGLLTNVAGLFFTPVAEDLRLERGSVGLTLTISNLAYALGGIFTPKLITEKNFRKVSAVLTGVLAGSTILMACAQNSLFLYGCSALRGIAGGILGFVLATTILNGWFHECNGLATSIAMSVSGITGALFSPILSALITAYGWRTGYICVGILMILLNLPLILFLPSLKPETGGHIPLGGEQETTHVSVQKNDHEFHVRGMSFLNVFLFAFLSCAVTAVPQHFPAVAEACAMSASVGAMMLSAGMLANTFGKIIMGFLTDLIGSGKTILIYALLVITGTVLLLVRRNPDMMLAGAVLIGLSYSLGTTGVVMLTKDTFGSSGYAQIYPVMSFAGTVGNALYSSIIGYLYDMEGNYDRMLRMTICFMIVAVLSAYMCYRKTKKETDVVTA